MIAGMEKAFDGKILAATPPEFTAVLVRLWAAGEPSPSLVRFAARLGSPDALRRAQALGVLQVEAHQEGDARCRAVVDQGGQVGEGEDGVALEQSQVEHGMRGA